MNKSEWDFPFAFIVCGIGMKKILVITSKTDEHADYIIEKCNSIGCDNIVRFNTEDFFSNIKTTFDGNSIRTYIKDSCLSFDTNEIYTVWYRRPVVPSLDNYEDEGIKKFMREQYTAYINGLYYCTHESSLWINDLRRALFAKNKIYQLSLANKIGFKVPKVIVSNDYDDILKFARHETICNKTLDVPRYSIDGQNHPYMTRKVTYEDIRDNKESIEACPSMFEEYIDKLYDIRVVIFGEHIYAFEIHSQSNELSSVDVRGVDPEKLEHRAHSLPQNIIFLIKEFMDIQGLVFSSMDLLLSKQGEYYFLENNVNGQWLWLEYMTSIDMSSSFIEFLKNHR